MDKRTMIRDTIAYTRVGAPNDTVERFFYERLLAVPDEQIKTVCERLLTDKRRGRLMLGDIDDTISAVQAEASERRDLMIAAARNAKRPKTCAFCATNIYRYWECPQCGARWHFDEERLEYLFVARGAAQALDDVACGGY